MNNQAQKAYNQYKDIVTSWSVLNLDAYQNACQLIQWIEDQLTRSDQQTRQDVQVTNWQSLLSGFPTEAIHDEIQRRIGIETIIDSGLSVCHMCGIAPTIRKEEKGYEIFCDQCRDTTFFFDTLQDAIIEWEQNVKNKLNELK